MKKILTVFTGGTIGSAAEDGQRKLSTGAAKRTIVSKFAGSSSPYAHLSEELFFDSNLAKDDRTLSENMTPVKLFKIIDHIKGFELSEYRGVIVLHGTDTLAYTAAMLSFVFSSVKVPVMLVSGNRPPKDDASNANANFRAAVELIMTDIAPGVYVPYRNTDGKMYLHLGSTLMQCSNYSEDFINADPSRAALIPEDGAFDRALSMAEKYSRLRCTSDEVAAIQCEASLIGSVLSLSPYVGLDYGRVSLEGVRAVVNGTYHSGTVCVERNEPTEDYSAYSVITLLDRCREAGIPVFAAPCKLGEEQYSSAFDASESGAVPLDMTTSAAYMKALAGVCSGLTGEALVSYMKRELSCEFMS